MYDMEEAFQFIEENKESMTWKEIKEYLNKKFDLNYSESAYRKPYTAFSKGVEFAMNMSYPLNQLDLIAKRRYRLKIEQKVLQKERYLVNDDLNKMATHKLFNNVILNKIKEKAPVIPKMELEKSGDKYFVFVMSDLHYTGFEDINYILAEVKELILEKQRELGFDRLVLAELGDIVEGATLRTSQLLAIKKGMIDQIIDVARAYGVFLNELSEHMFIDFKCVESSNHTQLRNQGTSRDELPMEDTMKVFTEFLKASTDNNKNIFIESSPEVITKINGDTFGFVHGHKASKDIKIAFADLNKEYDTDVDFVVKGHDHHLKVESHSKKGYKNREMISVPCMKVNRGSFETSHYMSSMPGVTLLIFDKNYGLHDIKVMPLVKSVKKHEVKEEIKKKVKKRV